MAALCVLVLSGGFAPAAADEITDDPEVRAANERLAATQERLSSLQERFDAAAAAYEHARAHHLRLLEEDELAQDELRQAEEAVAEHRASFKERVAEAYMRPGADLSLADAVLAAPDPATAVHRAALMERLTVRSGLRVERAEQTISWVQDGVEQRQIIAGGVDGAAADLQAAAAALVEQMDTARAAVAAGEQAVTEAEAAARERAEERARQEREAAAARAAAEAAAAAATATGAEPAVSTRTDGKVCPIGSPNSFIDSWGFPRSGGRQHQGVDIFAVHGMPLYAVADGVIQRVWNNRLGGLSINLIDDDGDRYYYAHLSAVHVEAGQRVSAGDVIGANGNTGNARTTPPHLHWQYHPGNGPPINPTPLATALCR